MATVVASYTKASPFNATNVVVVVFFETTILKRIKSGRLQLLLLLFSVLPNSLVDLEELNC